MDETSYLVSFACLPLEAWEGFASAALRLGYVQDLVVNASLPESTWLALYGPGIPVDQAEALARRPLSVSQRSHVLSRETRHRPLSAMLATNALSDAQQGQLVASRGFGPTLASELLAYGCSRYLRDRVQARARVILPPRTRPRPARLRFMAPPPVRALEDLTIEQVVHGWDPVLDAALSLAAARDPDWELLLTLLPSFAGTWGELLEASELLGSAP